MAVNIYPGIERKLARMPGVRQAVRAATEELGVRASANLAGNRSTGNARVEVTRDGTDGIVSLVDPNGGNAVAIEFGHNNIRSGEYVEGLYVLTGAVREMSND